MWLRARCLRESRHRKSHFYLTLSVFKLSCRTHPLLPPPHYDPCPPMFRARAESVFLSILNNTTCVTHTHTHLAMLIAFWVGWEGASWRDGQCSSELESDDWHVLLERAFHYPPHTHTHQSITSQCVGLIAHLQSVLASYSSFAGFDTIEWKRTESYELSDSLI